MFSQIPLLALLVLGPVGIFAAIVLTLTRKYQKEWRKPFLKMAKPAGCWLQSQADLQIEHLMIATVGMVTSPLVPWALWKGPQDTIGLAIIGIAATAFWIWRAIKAGLAYRQIRLGLLGEQLVGQVLDRLSSDRIRVFHDYQVTEPGKKPWNIDHVVLTPSGLFALETKTRRMPHRYSKEDPSHKVRFDGKRLVFPAPLKPDYSSLRQAARSSEKLSAILTQATAVETKALPMLVLPGWSVERRAVGDVTILNEESLPKYFSHHGSAFEQRQFERIERHLQEACKLVC
ncbi:NERD domain-containing protein [Luteolibacter ambystomatis]|uniref:NERD domain-containing protein n=1 Tax=Luteolibacter ambystomatis TaxID=2824561 RepID=A0A975IYW2_9BACT|nr:nuclease-related domain-containing protein [Luteolibacter ambystomatis]QUE50642.1 NERD domain-containing protein [Luteolibacter ambystomatis]